MQFPQGNETEETTEEKSGPERLRSLFPQAMQVKLRSGPGVGGGWSFNPLLDFTSMLAMLASKKFFSGGNRLLSATWSKVKPEAHRRQR